MFSRIIRSINSTAAQYNSVKNFNTSSQLLFKIAVAGACGGIGQPLSLLLKLNNLVTHLALYDLRKSVPGVALDLAHIDTHCKVTGHYGACGPKEAMADCHVLCVPAGQARKPGMTRDDLFGTNATVVYDIINDYVKYAPEKAIILIVTNPVNSVVPVAAEVLKRNNRLNPKHLFGITSLDSVRANTFVGEINGVDPSEVTVPVVCGHSPETMIPLISQSKPPLKDQSEEGVNKLIEKIRQAGTQVLNAKAGDGTATLSMAYAAARFTCSVLRGLSGESDVVECAFIKCEEGAEVPYYAYPILLGKDGMEKNLGIGEINEFEKGMIKKAIPTLIKNIQTGEKFVSKKVEKDR